MNISTLHWPTLMDQNLSWAYMCAHGVLLYQGDTRAQSATEDLREVQASVSPLFGGSHHYGDGSHG